jgi:hypothetical protein
MRRPISRMVFRAKGRLRRRHVRLLRGRARPCAPRPPRRPQQARAAGRRPALPLSYRTPLAPVHRPALLCLAVRARAGGAAKRQPRQLCSAPFHTVPPQHGCAALPSQLPIQRQPRPPASSPYRLSPLTFREGCAWLAVGAPFRDGRTGSRAGPIPRTCATAMPTRQRLGRRLCPSGPAGATAPAASTGPCLRPATLWARAAPPAAWACGSRRLAVCFAPDPVQPPGGGRPGSTLTPTFPGRAL